MIKTHKRGKVDVRGDVQHGIIPENHEASIDEEVDLKEDLRKSEPPTDLEDSQQHESPPDLENTQKNEPPTEPQPSTCTRRYLILWATFLAVCVIVVSIVTALVTNRQEQDKPTSDLTKETISRAYDTVYMTQKLYDEDPTLDIPGATVYTDEPDRALWVKKNDTCYAIFRATTPNIFDWLQNIPLKPLVNFQSPLGRNCTAIEGYHSAYFGTTFVNQFRNDVHNCVNSCGNKKCDLVVGGSSQGAGIATIAAVDLEDLNPILITTGQPPTLVEQGDGPCAAIDSSRYFRFVNTDQDPSIFGDAPHLNYDLVSGLAIPNGTDWLGNLFILSENDGGLAHYPNGVRPNILPTMWHANAHLMVNYLPRLEALKNSTTFPIPTKGWVDGSLCNFDGECQSGVCRDYKCIPSGSNGTPCNDASDCLLGRCDGLVKTVCQPKLDDGTWCTEDSDCLSENCSFGKCQV